MITESRKGQFPRLGSIKRRLFFALQQQHADTADPQVEFEAYSRNCAISSISLVRPVGAMCHPPVRFVSIANLGLLNVGTFRLTSMQAPVHL